MVVPNIVDPISGVSLFSQLSSNVVVFTVIVILWALYFLGLFHAHRADKRDECLIGPISLPENRPTHQAQYEVVVLTGARPNDWLVLFRVASLDRERFGPVFPIRIGDYQRNGRADGAPVANAGDN